MSDKNPIFIVSPCYNENITVVKFLEELESTLLKVDQKFLIVVIDDASTDNTLNLLKEYKTCCENVEIIILSLKYNLGHQGAIYQGLLYANTLGAAQVIVMDSDGEDDPAAILELVKYVDTSVDIVNVVRGKRKERFFFRFFYSFYKLIFNFITSSSMNFGNYCMINNKVLASTADTSFIHFAAHLSKQKATFAKITYDRRCRLDGKSKMNLTSLIHHAFKSFVEYAEDLLMVFLKLFILLIIIIIGLIIFILYKKLFTNEAILGWASTLSSSLFNSAIICLGFFVIGILLLNIMSKNSIRYNKDIYTVVK